MNVKTNIGILNALIRIMIGLTVLSWSTAKLVKYPWRDSYLFIALCGAMKVAEGIVRYCPVTDLYEKYQELEPDTNRPYGQMESMDGMEGLTNANEDQVNNPS